MDALRKTAAVGPGSLASTLLTVAVGAGLPAPAATVLFYGGLIALVLLCTGIGEKTAVRILFMAKEATDAERDALAPITSSLWQLGLGPPVVHLYLAQKAGAAEARAVGRRSVIVSSELELAIQAGRLPQAESLALIVHAASLARAGHTRSDPAIAFWSLPWCVLRTLLRWGRSRCQPKSGQSQWTPSVSIMFKVNSNHHLSRSDLSRVFRTVLVC